MMKTISLIRAVSLALLTGCSAIPESGERTNDIAKVEQLGDADKLYIVDCLLPGQIRKLGRNMTFLTARLPIKATAVECEIRGGEYTAYDRANYATSLNIWLPKAQSGNPEAQAYT
ncbi:MAG: peptidase C14 caspase catalytic subunit p20, partial [Methylococcaceae bacterium]